VAVLSNPANPGHPAVLKEMDVAARTLKVKVQRLDVRNPSDLKSALQAATQGRAEGLIALDDSFFFSERVQILGLVARSRLPAVYGFREMAEAGGLMVYLSVDVAVLTQALRECLDKPPTSTSGATS
jgi:putative ABC transport system substrate-binding protein